MDNFSDICGDGQVVAIFECAEVFFGSVGFKPKDLFIFTSRGLRIVASDKLKFNIPMGHIKVVNVEFMSTTNSLIVICITAQYAAKIEKMIKAAQKVDLTTDGTNFTNATITLVCDKLSGRTKNVIRGLFQRMSEIEEESAKKILRALKRAKKNSAKLSVGDQTVFSLMKLKPSSFSKRKSDTATGLTLSYAEIETDRSATLPGPSTSSSCMLAESIDLPALFEAPPDSPPARTEFAEKEKATDEITISSAIVDETSLDLPQSSAHNDNRQILLYQNNEGDISLSVGDYVCLSRGEYLNDKIIDFYLKYIKSNVIRTNEERERTHIFSSYFYHVLTFKDRLKEKTDGRTEAEMRYERVRNWTKNVNIFEKDFIFVPVNERLHWFLIVICFPNMLVPVDGSNRSGNDNGRDDIVRQPVILIFNSMADTTSYRSTSILRDYLTCEYNAKMPKVDNPPNFTKDTMPGHRVKVPQQNNSHDCGLYVLQYVEEFFKQPIKDFRVPISQLSDWFDSMAVVRKREEIAKLIQQLIEAHHQAKGTSPNVKLPKISFPTLNGELLPLKAVDKTYADKSYEIVKDKKRHSKREIFKDTC